MANIPLPEPARVAPVLGVLQNVYTAEQMRAYAAADNAALRAELANARAADIHSCHAGCTRAGCVNARLREERDALREDAERYRWLRNNPEWLGWDSDFQPDEVEREIDEARGVK